jgi:hypothetical protein
MSDADDLTKAAASTTPLTHEGAVAVEAAVLDSGSFGDIILSQRTANKDQGELAGLCSPCAITTSIEHALKLELSAPFAYWNVQKDRGDSTEGALMGEMAHSLQRHGICKSELYTEGVPSSGAVHDAMTRFPIVVPFLEPGEAAAKEVLVQLHAGNKVAFGCPVDRSFLNYRPNKNWDTISIFTCKQVFDAPIHIINDHAMCIVGHRVKDDAFLVQSSWGESWGMNGYAWISRKYLTMWGSAGFCYAVAE